MRSAPVEQNRRALRLRVAGLGLLALAGMAVAIGATRDPDTSFTILTATGGSVTVERPDENTSALAAWPRDRDAWTIILVSVPKNQGRAQAVAIAELARKRGLTPTGVLDSSRYPSLRPGYWMAYQGVFASEAAANGALARVRQVSRSAHTERVAG